MKKHFNRFLSYFLVFAMILASISPIGVVAEEAEGENIAGLYATMDVEWDDAAQKNYVRDAAAYHSELYSWVSGAIMHFVMRDEQGNETPITDTSSIYALTEGGNPTEAITFGHSNDGDGIVTLSFHDVGVYQIGFEAYEGYTLRLVVEYPPIGFYSQDTVSAAANLFDYNYSNLGGESFYLVPREEAINEDITVSDNSLFKVTYWNESAGENVEVTDTEELEEFITWTKGTGENDIPEGVYKIDVAQGCATEFALSAFCTDTWYTDEDKTEISGEPTREEAFLFLHYEYVPDGLVGTFNLDFEDRVPKLADDPYFAEQLDASMPSVIAVLKYISRDGAGEVTEEFLTSEDIIVVDENDDEVTEDVVTWGKHPDASEDYYIEFIFNQAGDYKIGYCYDKEENLWDYIDLSVNYPNIGFYKEASYESEYLKDNRFASSYEDAAFYTIIRKSADEYWTHSLSDTFLSVRDHVEDEFVEVSDYLNVEAVSVPEEDKDTILAIYKLTPKTRRGFEVIIKLDKTHQAEEEIEEDIEEGFINVWYEEDPEPVEGLKIGDWIEWENETPYIHGESGLFGEFYAPVKEFRTFALVMKDEDGVSQTLGGEFTISGNGIDEMEIPEDPESNTNDAFVINKIHSDAQAFYFDLEFKQVGDYVINYKVDGVVIDSVIIHGVLPFVGIYNEEVPSVDCLVEGDLITYQDGKDYYVITSKIDDEIPNHISLDIKGYEKDAVSLQLISSDEEHTVYQLVTKADMNASFDMFMTHDICPFWDAECVRYGVERYYRMIGTAKGRVAYTDGLEHLGYAGCYLYDYEYEVGGPNWETEEPIYYVHADSVQGVIDKLSAVANGEEVLVNMVEQDGVTNPDLQNTTKDMTVVNTGYVSINVSHFGDTKLEEQYVSSSGNMKGIVLTSGCDWVYTKHDLEDGYYIEDMVFRFKDAYVAQNGEEALGELPAVLSSCENISLYQNEYYEVDYEEVPFDNETTGYRYVLGNKLELDGNTREIVDRVVTFIYEGRMQDFRLQMDPFVQPEVHVNVYCDMKFSGAFESLAVGFKEGKNFSAQIMDAVLPGEQRDEREVILTIEDLVDGETGEINRTAVKVFDYAYQAPNMAEVRVEDKEISLYLIDSETTTEGTFNGSMQMTEAPEPNAMTELTDDQREAIENSMKLTVKVKADGKKESELDKTVVEDVKKVVKGEKDGAGYKGFEYVDIGLTATVEGVDDEVDITEMKAESEITIEIPDNLRKKGRKFKIVRHHIDEKGNKKTEVIHCTVSKDGKYITFKSNRFSTYAIAYDSGEKANFDMSKVKWNYSGAFTEDGTAKTVVLTGLPAGLSVSYTGNTASAVGTYTAKASFTYDDFMYNAPDVSKISSLTWEIKEPSKVGEKVSTSTGKYKVTSDSGSKKEVTYTAPKSKTSKSVKIPSSVKIGGVSYKVTAIADNAFSGNKKMTSVTIPSSVQKVGKNAFKNCTKLKKVTLPKNVTSIGNNAFYGCKNLKTVKISSSKVKSVGTGAFRKCSALTSVIIPKGVTSIGKDAFRDCKKLKTITIKSTTIKSIGKNAFKNVSSKVVIKLPKKKFETYKSMLLKKGVSKKAKFKKG